MLNDLIISIANIPDVPSIVQLVNSAYRGEVSKKGWTTEADLLDGIRIEETSLLTLMDRQDATFLKRTNKQNDILGCVYLQLRRNEMYLGMLSVSPERQASGIGKLLLEASEQYALERACSTISISVISIRHELISWYERRGYKHTGEKLPFPDDPRFGIPKQPLEFIVMKKELK